MSTSLLNYSGIITKIKALESDLLKKEDYQKIAYLETTVDFVNYIKANPSYAIVFDNLDEQQLHRAQIEQLLTNAIHVEFSKLYRFASGEQRKSLSFIFFRFEVNVLKLCLKKIFTEEDSYDLLMFAPFFERHSALDVNKLAASKTIEEFISNLQGTNYHSLFQKLYETHHDSLPDYEVQLDIYYFKTIWKMKDRVLKGKNKKVVTSVYGAQIDLLNLLWIYRSKKFFDIETGKILANIIPVNYKLKKQEITKLVEAVSIDEFIKILHTTYYAKLENEIQHDSIETLYYKAFAKIYEMNCRNYRVSIAPAFYFMYKKELELDLLTTALECIRYKLDPTEILTYLQQ